MWWRWRSQIHTVMSDNPVQFYGFLQNRVMIAFEPKFEDSNPESKFSLVLDLKVVVEVAARECEYACCPPLFLDRRGIHIPSSARHSQHPNHQ